MQYLSWESILLKKQAYIINKNFNGYSAGSFGIFVSFFQYRLAVSGKTNVGYHIVSPLTPLY